VQGQEPWRGRVGGGILREVADRDGDGDGDGGRWCVCVCSQVASQCSLGCSMPQELV